MKDFCEEYKRSAAGEELPAGRNSSPRVTLEQKPFIFFPELRFSGDNGAMVASAAFFEIKDGKLPTDPYKLNIYPRTEIK